VVIQPENRDRNLFGPGMFGNIYKQFSDSLKEKNADILIKKLTAAGRLKTRNQVVLLA
jgi:hypothetical protein